MSFVCQCTMARSNRAVASGLLTLILEVATSMWSSKVSVAIWLRLLTLIAELRLNPRSHHEKATRNLARLDAQV